MIVAPSLSARTRDPCIADIHVIRSRDVTDAAYGELALEAVRLARQLDVGYMDCLMSVAACCDNLLRVLRRAGFTSTLVIPRAVDIAHRGLVDYLVLHQSLGLPHRQPRTADEVLQMLKKQGICDGPESDAAFERCELLQSSFLPKTMKVKQDLTMVIRNMRKEDVTTAYQLFQECIDRGEGYAAQVCPCLAYFRRDILTELVVVFEDTSNGRMIGWWAIRMSPRMRTKMSRCSEQRIVFAKEYQSRGIGTFVRNTMTDLRKDLGIDRDIGTIYVNNFRSLRQAQFYRQRTVLGTIPRAGFVNDVNGAGLINQVIAMLSTVDQ